MYTYDDAGNILTKTSYAYTSAGTTPTVFVKECIYSYGNSAWGDQLTSYNDTPIEYDAIGNPLSYYNGSSYAFTWENGRQLATASVGDYELSFEYNDEGIRTSKIVNGVEHIYRLSNSLIMEEEYEFNISHQIKTALFE